MDNFFQWAALIVSALSTLCTIILSWTLFKKENNKTYLKERYEKVIFPIFNILEFHLYKKELNSEIKNAIKECETIIDNNKLIAGGKLSFLFSRPMSKENFMQISKLIDKEYDKCCSSLGIPLRPLDKKAATFSIRNIRVLVLWIIKYTLPLIIFLMLISSALLFVHSFFNRQ